MVTKLSQSQPIVIIGAGVLGLTTAYLLQDRYPTARITIVAAETPLAPPVEGAPRPSPDYASMWAGAHLRPTPGFSGQLAQEHLFALKTSERMRSLALQTPESGVQRIIGCEVMEYIPNDKARYKDGDTYAGPDDNFRVLSSHELHAGAKWGCEYTTWVLNVHIYCRWLLTNFIRRGGNLVQKTLPRLEDAFQAVPGSPKTPLVVNCSGRNFDTDPKTNVIRGQTVLVKNTYHKTATRHNTDGSWSFLIPRPLGGGTIVGGTKQHGDMGTEIRPQETKDILENAVKSWPDFVSKVDNFEIVMVNVGRRPWRDGGLRIEAETLDKEHVVIHGYGAGARGYELSWGAADQIANLVGEHYALAAKL